VEIDGSTLKILLTSLITLFTRCTPVVHTQTLVADGTGVQHGDSPFRIHHEGYTVLYSETHEQPYWVSYTLTKDEVNGPISRDDDFREDPSVPTESASLADYKGSGYDRGHLKPAADSKATKIEMSESFFMSNMSPQKQTFNREIWEQLEEQVRDYAIAYDSIYIVTGPVLNNPIDVIGDNQVSVPEAYFKVILSADKTRSIGFLLPHENSKKPLSTFAVSVDSIEKVTGFDFFPGVSDSIDSVGDYSAW